MIIVKSPDQCDIDNIYFTDAIHNSANNSTFSRVVSTDRFAAFNGLYIKLPLRKVNTAESGDRTNIKCIAHYNVDHNTKVISTIQAFERDVLALYLRTFNVVDKDPCLHIADTLMSGSLRLGCEQHPPDVAAASASSCGAGDDAEVATYACPCSRGYRRNHGAFSADDEPCAADNIILKISGVWETDKTVGVTFKYVIALPVGCIARN
jgi:hypothetical protein